MPVIETKGAASSGGFGQFARQVAANYIEDVFSTWLYTGNGSTQTITNGIDLSTKGGLVWNKFRSTGSGSIYAASHALTDTLRGTSGGYLMSNSTAAQSSTYSDYAINSFSATGFTLSSAGVVNDSGSNYVSWTFRKQAKFFDVVTWTGDGTFNGSRTINHALGGTVGTIIVKNTSSSGTNWIVFHRSLPTGYFVFLNATNAQTQLLASNAVNYVIENVTSTSFTVNHGGNSCNASGQTYIAYLFAHDAGGFGAAGTDNVISCGTYTGTDADLKITLGWEPQFVLLKQVTASSSTYGNWQIYDNMRGLNASSTSSPYGFSNYLLANTDGAETSATPNKLTIDATGFTVGDTQSVGTWTYVYIAIRRGPMRAPTSGTSVFTSNAYTGTATTTEYNVGLVGDLSIVKRRTTSGEYTLAFDRLRGDSLTLALNRDWADTAPSYFGAGRLFPAFSSSGKQTVYQYRTSDTAWNASGVSYIDWFFKRAPGFFDVVCYIGDGNSDRSVPHNLSVKPELVIVKQRDVSVNGYSFPWKIYSKSIPDPDNNVMGFDSSGYGYRGPYGVKLSTTNATNLVVNAGYEVNEVSKRYVAYLFASCAGVSSVGSYTGTGTTQQINCGFTGGARFVLIKRIDPGSPYDWYVWDTARGIVAGNDPYLLLNNSNAEVTSTDYIDTLSTGFEISNTAPEAINGSGGTFIYLAIA